MRVFSNKYESSQILTYLDILTEKCYYIYIYNKYIKYIILLYIYIYILQRYQNKTSFAFLDTLTDFAFFVNVVFFHKNQNKLLLDKFYSQKQNPFASFVEAKKMIAYKTKQKKLQKKAQ